MGPLFSVIVPLFNRESTLPRCINSVLAQRFANFELILVDDGSLDGSLTVLRCYDDARIRLVALAENRGVCPARNAGIDQACGEWLVFLDSDDEFTGGEALAVMAERVHAAAGVDALWFRSVLDDGKLSPQAVPAHDLDYRGYIAFLETTFGGSRDMIRCVRATCFKSVRYPDNRMLEEKFHLDFARAFRSRMHGEVLRRYHQDAPNQLTRMVAAIDRRRDRIWIRDRAAGFAALLVDHGPALARFAPRVHLQMVQRAIKLGILAGEIATVATLIATAVRLAALAHFRPARFSDLTVLES